MDSGQWTIVQGIFLEAVQIVGTERDAFLESRCGEDPALIREVRSLLDAHAHAGSFLEEEPVAAEAGGAPYEGRVVGRYRLTQRIGLGGMGDVYVAERADALFDMRVAVKIIRAPGLSKHAIERFESERQILAVLNHPSIARLMDAGVTPEDVPYFVMEYVDGVPIDEYCRAHRLSLEDRLRLFMDVCTAVQFAHKHLVVHRDLKPSNIFVTAGGQVKLLDFGIAKLLNRGADDTALTVDMVAMTPDYASPEQVRGQPITTASDVYQLGILLYELLTGKRPYVVSSASPSAIQRIICEQPPTRPSTAVSASGGDDGGRKPDLPQSSRDLERRLRGDLDNIMLKALRKEPERRYGSAEQFAQDIRRHLDRKPVYARPDTVLYRADRFVSRHRLGVAASATVVLALLTSTVVSLHHSRVADRERMVAQEHFQDIRELTGALIFEIHDEIIDLPGATRAREMLVARGLEYMDRLTSQASDDPRLHSELIRGYQRLGDAQGNPVKANLGDVAGARRTFLRGLEIAEDLVTRYPEDLEAQVSRALMLERLSDVEAFLGNVDLSLLQAEEALVTYERMAAEHPDRRRAQMYLAIGHIKVADVAGHPAFPNTGDAEKALRHYEASRDVLLEMFSADSTDTGVMRHTGLVHERLGTIHLLRGEIDAARASYERSLERRKWFAERHPNHMDGLRDLGIAHQNMSKLQAEHGDFASARSSFERALAIFANLYRADQESATAAFTYGYALFEYGKLFDPVYVRAGADLNHAAELYMSSRETIAPLVDTEEPNVRIAAGFDEVSAALGALEERN